MRGRVRKGKASQHQQWFSSVKNVNIDTRTDHFFPCLGHESWEKSSSAKFDELGTKFKCRGSCDNFNEREKNIKIRLCISSCLISPSCVEVPVHLRRKTRTNVTTACSIKCLHDMFQHTSCVQMLRASLDHVRENENDHSSSQSSLHTKV